MDWLKSSARRYARTSLAWLGAALAMSMGMGFASGAEDQRPPNIILIVADDVGWGDVGFNGRTEWSTPNLDRLARQGTIFRRLYTAAVVCAEPGGLLDREVLDPLGSTR